MWSPNLLIPLASDFASQVSLGLPILSPHVQCHPQVAHFVIQTPIGHLPRNALQVHHTKPLGTGAVGGKSGGGRRLMRGCDRIWEGDTQAWTRVGL